MTDLIKAADALSDATKDLRNAQRAYLASKEYRDPIDIQQSRGAQVGKCAAIVDTALTAYRQARESADGVNTDGLFNDIEDILYDCIVSIQGEVSGLEEAYVRITARIKAALED